MILKNNKKNNIRLGVNIDHVATIRNARGGSHPDLIRAAEIVADSGADGITIHLREDRRHILDNDAITIIKNNVLPVNLEIAATEEMLSFATKYLPNAVCIVPERREEKTTEGGLNVTDNTSYLKNFVSRLLDKGLKVSLFIEPEQSHVEASFEIGANAVELHTGKYSNTFDLHQEKEFLKIKKSADLVCKFGLECHAGHGLTYDNVFKIASIKNISELNIGHFLISEAIFLGLKSSIHGMKSIIDKARN